MASLVATGGTPTPHEGGGTCAPLPGASLPVGSVQRERPAPHGGTSASLGGMVEGIGSGLLLVDGFVVIIDEVGCTGFVCFSFRFLPLSTGCEREGRGDGAEDGAHAPQHVGCAVAEGGPPPVRPTPHPGETPSVAGFSWQDATTRLPLFSLVHGDGWPS